MEPSPRPPPPLPGGWWGHGELEPELCLGAVGAGVRFSAIPPKGLILLLSLHSWVMGKVIRQPLTLTAGNW